MTGRLIAVGLLLWCWAAAALGQNWAVYAPPEGDFRVLFPAQPVRTAEPQGAVAFKATFSDKVFIVYRRDPAKQPLGNPARDIEERLRGGNEEKNIKRLTKKDEDGPREYVYASRGIASIHRVFPAEGRYYELVVEVPREELGRTRLPARDFFGSFQLGNKPLAASAQAAVTPDVLCKERSNAFSRGFCEYSTCLKSQHRGQPYCQKLLHLR